MNATVSSTNPEKIGLRVEDYFALARDGAFDDYGRTELIDGDIYAMNAQYSRHGRAKFRLAAALSDALNAAGSKAEVMIEVSIHLTSNSAPEPDITVTTYEGDDAIPLDTVLMIVEISDTTLAIDLGRKADLYARAGISEYWVVDVEGREVHRLRHPSDNGFSEKNVTAFGEPLTATVLGGLPIPTNTL